jgi:hypothetical protein
MRKTNENTEKNTARNTQSDSKNVKNCGGKGCGKKNTKNCK